ncbi:hypothetical protein [Actinomadura macra]|uniref:hypothetical protein n=1 Tax=Actinomadura macra TaxID=46164 RepID=UPI0008297466|nr:hypothetical protein [Actinomadura macra]
MTAASPTLLSPRLVAFEASTQPLPSLDGLFVGTVRYAVQTPPERNEYKKSAGSSDGARTYDTTAR